MAEIRETDEFEDWARLADLIGECTRSGSASVPVPNGRPRDALARNGDDVYGPGAPNSKARQDGPVINGPVINGKSAQDAPLPNIRPVINGGAMNGRAKPVETNTMTSRSVVDQIPSFLMDGPADDDERFAGALLRPAEANKAAGDAVSRGHKKLARKLFRSTSRQETNGHAHALVDDRNSELVVADVSARSNGEGIEVLSEAAIEPFILTEALPEDLEIPAEPKQRPAGGVLPVLETKIKSRAPLAEGRPPVAAEVRESPKRPPAPGPLDLPGAAPVTKRMGITAPPIVDRRGSFRRRVGYRLRKGATVAAVGVTIGGVAVAVLYIVIIAVSTIF